MIPGLAGIPGLDEDDEEQKRLKGIGGSIGEQMGAPVMPPAPPPVAPPQDDTLPVDASALPAPPPQIASYQPAPPAPIPPSRTVSPAEAANLGALDANAKAGIATAQQEGDIERQKAESMAAAADANADTSNGYLAQRNQIQADAEKAIAQRQKQADQDYQKYRDFGIKDPDADQSFGHRLLTGIAVALGAYAQGIQGGENHALAIIQKANADNIAQQKAQQDKLFRIAEKSGEDVEQARKQRDDAFKQLDLKHAALLQNSADVLKAQLARMGIPEAQIAANKDVQAAEKESLQLREKYLRDIAQDETSLARADIAAAARRHKAGAGGGSGGTDALTKFVEAAGALKAGDPIPPEVAVLGRQAGLKPNQIAAEVDRYRGSGLKAQKGEDQHARATDRQEAMVVTGTNGEDLGMAHSPQDAAKLRSANVAFDQFKTRTQALIDDIRKNPRAWDDESTARRDALAAAVAAAGRKYNDLGVSNANVALEKQMIGPNGSISHGIIDMVRGGKVDVLEHMLSEAEERHNGQLKTYLRRPAASAPAAAPSSPAAPAAAPTQGPSLAKKAQALQWARANPGNPKAKAILEALGAQ